MPSLNTFDLQPNEYKAKVLRSSREKTFSLEMSSTLGWYKYSAYPYGINTFGASGKDADLIKHFKFTKEDVASFIMEKLK